MLFWRAERIEQLIIDFYFIDEQGYIDLKRSKSIKRKLNPAGIYTLLERLINAVEVDIIELVDHYREDFIATYPL